MTNSLSMKTRPLAHRIVGIDYGLVRIGIALSDERKIIATPLMIVTAEKKNEETAHKLIKTLKEHAEEHHYIIDEIVIGLPLMMSGKKGMIADEVVGFVELMRQHIDIPITTWDERLTSVQADRSLREGSMSRKKRASFVDTVAACIILQNYLDRLNISP